MLEISHSNVLKLCLWQKQEVEALASQLIELEKYLISFPISSANLFLHDSSPHICPIGLVARLYFKKCNPCIIYWGLLATASRIFRILQYSCDCDRLPAPSPPFPPQSVTPPPPWSISPLPYLTHCHSFAAYCNFNCFPYCSISSMASSSTRIGEIQSLATRIQSPQPEVDNVSIQSNLSCY
jgi:hypothetical protein